MLVIGLRKRSALGKLEHAPLRHHRDFIDFIYVLQGEIVLELDEGREVLLKRGDTAVQNGTRHAWRNRSGAPCRLLVRMSGAARREERY